jgi:hypothetical protein
MSRRQRLERWSRRLRGRPTAHFLHIGKTAGTAVKTGLEEATGAGNFHLMLHSHNIRLIDIPEDDFVFFCVRDPVGRFVSGFRSRQRQGQPAHFRPWRPSEAEAFALFSSPDALGLALGAGGEEQRQAAAAMGSIAHVNRSYWWWFKDAAFLRARAEHILWIGRQEHLDLAPLERALGLEHIVLPSDPARDHRGPPGPDTELSPRARDLLRNWYAADYEFLALCDELDEVIDLGDRTARPDERPTGS